MHPASGAGMNQQGGESSGAGEFTLRVVPSLGAIPASQWSLLSGSARRDGAAYNPFLSHAFLSSLEESGCVSRQTGWLPQHLKLEAPDGRMLGAVPCYLKSHSQGEYVFDYGWADAFERAGGRYYPKLQVSIPFTPATGPRLLVTQGENPATVHAALAEGLKALCGRISASSVHVTFAPEEEARLLEQHGFLHRTDQQFHFFNEGYASYDDFLSTLASRKRKALKKERRTALENGITIDRLTGGDITEAALDDFFAFYMDTGSRKWGQPYLNREFYSLVAERMADDILLVMARRNGRYVAGAINFIGSDTLYGRNWGCVEDHPFLHFEVCYHQAIDFAIERGLKVVEAGAQGEHKLARGYMPVTTHSAHHIEHGGLRGAVEDYLERERRDVAAIGEYLSQRGPFRKGE
jgi:predicted N-acyltransferase